MKKNYFLIIVAGTLFATNIFGASDRKEKSRKLKQSRLETKIMYSKETSQEEYIACLEKMIEEHSSDIQLAVHELRDVFNQRRQISSVGGRGPGDTDSPEALVQKLTPLYCDDPATVEAIIKLLPEHIRTTVAAEEDADLILKLISAFMFSRARRGTQSLDQRCFVELHDAVNAGSMEFAFGSTEPQASKKSDGNRHCQIS